MGTSLDTVGKKDAELNPERLGKGEEGNPTQKEKKKTSSSKMVKAIQEYGIPPYLKVVLELASQFQFVSRSGAASLWTQQNRTLWYPEQLLQSENP